MPTKNVTRKRTVSAAARPAFPIAGVGASAGGLGALTALLKSLPARPGLALVVVQRLDPQPRGDLAGILARASSMPVRAASAGVHLQPDHVYVMPPNGSLILKDGVLSLLPRPRGSATLHPIDEFFSSLAQERQIGAIGVILSGSGADGTRGLRAIRSEGGVAFAQDPATAEWPSMPASAIASGAVDFALPPKRIAAELLRLGRHPYLQKPLALSPAAGVEIVCARLRAATGVDFRLYKRNTLERRIARRMALLRTGSLARYARLLEQNPAEAKLLAEDLLIHVTGFFRDPACFDALRKRVFPKLLAKMPAGKPAGQTIRVWVPGCSTGEEAYSLAMLLLEWLGARASRTRLQIFGTDLSESALEQARAGIYSESAVAGVSAARLKRFFVKSERGFQIHKAVRDACVFAKHDLGADPPFSHLDLISCRNVLIYMEPALQKRALETFQYALLPGKTLILGMSEGPGAGSESFTVVDDRHRIFSRKAGPVVPPRFDWLAENGKPQTRRAGVANPRTPSPGGVKGEAEQLLLKRYMPASLIVDADLRVVHLQGDTAPYLVLAAGPPVFDVMKLVRPEFLAGLRGAISKARKAGVATSSDPVDFEHHGQRGSARIEVSLLRGVAERKPNFLVVFAELPRRDRVRSLARGAKAGIRSRLEQELASTREYLRSLVAEHEAVQEEMKAAVEESRANNEELQSANEELETAKEELQSSNEELTTLNEELRQRNAELDVLGDDLANLLVGVQIPVVVLDGRLHVRRFTPLAGQLLNLIEADIGRPFRDLASTLSLRDWDACFLEVILQARTVEREVMDRHGYWYSLRLHPYRTRDNSIDGVIVVLLDIDLIKRPLLAEARESRDYASVLLESSGQAVIAFAADGKIVLVNSGVENMFGYRRDEVIGQPLTRLLPENSGQPPAQHLARFFTESASRTSGLGLALDARRKDGASFPAEVSLSMIQRSQDRLAVAFVADITERRRLEALSEGYRAQIHNLAAQLITVQEEERRRVSRELHDSLCQRLASLALAVDGLETEVTPPVRAHLRTLQAQLVQASEEARHIAYELHPSTLDDLGLVLSLKALCDDFSSSEAIAVRFTASRLPDAVPQEVGSGLYRIAQESLQNVAKHSMAKHVSVELTVPGRSLRLSIKDDGVGFDLPAVRGKGGLGMISMGERARMMGGQLSMQSRPGQGAEIAVRVPMEWRQ